MDAARSFSDVLVWAAPGRGGLTAAGLIAVSLAIGVADVGLRPEKPSQPLSSAEPVRSARLPRMRPDEAPAVASVDPFTADLIVQGPVQAVRSGSSAAQASSIEDLRSRAFLIASSSAECDHVVNSEVLQGGGPDALVVIGIRCGNGARFYLDRDAILSNHSASSTPAAAALTGAEAIRACEDKLRTGLAVPPSLNRLPSTTGIDAISDGDAVVNFDFDALNGLGFPVFMHVRCEIRERAIARLDVAPR